jgi:cytochrome c oxidase cbb3-type subunit 3
VVTAPRTALVLLAALALAGCKREVRDLRTDPAIAAALNRVAPMPNRIGGAPPRVTAAMDKPYDNNAWQLSQGKRLFGWFNCTGCHADGGGGAGPALTDGWWRYGPDDVSIFLTIRDGRPNGMPSFGKRLTAEQIWQLTGYVRTMGATSAKTAAPGRNDDIEARPAENRAPAMAEYDMHASR